MKLVSMTNFVLGIVKINYPNNIMKFRDCKNYANFLKKPLELWMFVACDENGNYLPEPESRGVHPHYITEPTNEELEAYNDWLEAKERCLFEGLDKIDADTIMSCEDCKTVEDLIIFDLELTPTAQKQIGI